MRYKFYPTGTWGGTHMCGPFGIALYVDNNKEFWQFYIGFSTWETQIGFTLIIAKGLP